MWKHLEHPNIVSLLGITQSPFQLISEWVPGGDLREYIKTHPSVDRLGLVGVPLVMSDPTLTLATSYPMLPKVFAFCTLAI